MSNDLNSEPINSNINIQNDICIPIDNSKLVSVNDEDKNINLENALNPHLKNMKIIGSPQFNDKIILLNNYSNIKFDEKDNFMN